MRFELPRPLIQRPRSAAACRYRQQARANEVRPWRAASFAVVDLETTGLDARRHEIISWAVVHVDGGRIPAGAVHYGLVRPHRMPEQGVDRRPRHPALPTSPTAPSPETAFDQILDAVTGRVVVAHAAWFEKAFLARAAARRGVRWRSPMIDTSVTDAGGCSSATVPAACHPLASLTRALGLPAHRPHHAAGDALTTAQAFLAIATHLDAIHPQTSGTLVEGKTRVAEIRRLEPPEGDPKPWAREAEPEPEAAADAPAESAPVEAPADDAPATD